MYEKITFLGAACGNHLIVDQIRRGTRKHEIAFSLADDLVPGRERDQVREPGCVDKVAIAHKLGYGLAQGNNFGLGHLLSRRSRGGF